MLTFAGKAEVGHWLEEDDNLQHKLYWRQTFCRETQELSVSFHDTMILENALIIPRNFGHTVSATATLILKLLCTSVIIHPAKFGFTRTV